MPTTLEIPLCQLTEIARSDREVSSRVDAQEGIIRGVKVLGLESANTGRTLGLDAAVFGDALDLPYSYSREALAKAAPLYEGLGVYVDHPEFSYTADGARLWKQRDRKTAERFGRLANVRVTESGLYADLEYLRSHPLAPLVVEAALRMPEMLGLSHHASGRPALVGGRIVIEEIVDVRSVDIIGERPGTTQGLFESRNADNSLAYRQDTYPTSDGEAVLLESVVMLTAAGLPVLVPQLKALRALSTTAERQALVDSLPRPSSIVPRSQPPARSLVEQSGKSQFDVSTPDKAIAALRGI